LKIFEDQEGKFVLEIITPFFRSIPMEKIAEDIISGIVKLPKMNSFRQSDIMISYRYVLYGTVYTYTSDEIERNFKH